MLLDVKRIFCDAYCCNANGCVQQKTGSADHWGSVKAMLDTAQFRFS